MYKVHSSVCPKVSIPLRNLFGCPPMSIIKNTKLGFPAGKGLIQSSDEETTKVEGWFGGFYCG